MKNTKTDEEGVSTGVADLTLTSPHSDRCDDPNYVSASKDVQSTSQSPNAALSATRVATSTNFAPPTHRFSILAFSLLSLITQAPTSKSCPPGTSILTVLPLQHRRYPRQLRVVGRICHFYDCSAPPVPIYILYSSVDPPLQPTWPALVL